MMAERIRSTLQIDSTFLFSLATVGEDGRPKVRIVRGTIDEGFTLRCPTFANTAKVRHIRACGEVHVTCGNTATDRPGSYFQIEGHATISSEAEDRHALWSDRLRKWFDSPDDPRYVVVVIQPYRIAALPIGGGPAAAVWESKSGENEAR